MGGILFFFGDSKVLCCFYINHLLPFVAVRTGKYGPRSWCTARAQRGPYKMTEVRIFPYGTLRRVITIYYMRADIPPASSYYQDAVVTSFYCRRDVKNYVCPENKVFVIYLPTSNNIYIKYSNIVWSWQINPMWPVKKQTIHKSPYGAALTGAASSLRNNAR